MTALTRMATLLWLQERQVEWHYSAPGKPQQNAFIESFMGANCVPHHDLP
jgi:putative transposase